MWGGWSSALGMAKSLDCPLPSEKNDLGGNPRQCKGGGVGKGVVRERKECKGIYWHFGKRMDNRWLGHQNLPFHKIGGHRSVQK